ncbi:MAG: hypothetical protein HY727_19815 [Candidatus Rokubacteria bacterium]|nr:hypothetical protein [Candidatus Rokubacteria bacterium]
MVALKMLLILMVFIGVAVSYGQERPKDQPVEAQGSAEVREYRAAIAPYVEEARRSYPNARKRYLSGLPPGHTFFVVTKLRDRKGTEEQVFVVVTSIRHGRISGQIASEILGVSGYRKGDTHSFSEGELMDWVITRPDGTEEGNVVGKFLDEWQKTRRRK